MADQLYGD